MNNCNQILNHWLRNNLLYYDKLKNNLGNNISLHNIDHNCARNSLRKREFITKDQKCVNCHLLSKMTKNDTYEKKIEITYGRYKNKTLSLQTYDCLNKSLKYSTKIKKISKVIYKILI